MTHPALQLTDVRSGYGESIVLKGVSLAVTAGEAVALLGKNGMGKTTLLKTVMGYLPKKSGSVHFDGHDITNAPTHRISHLGVAYAAQEHALFTELSIRDNLQLGLPKARLFEERFATVESVFPVFKSRLNQHAGTLSGGEQKMLLVARALMMMSPVILLDEIAEGLQPSVVERIAEALISNRQRHGTTLLMVEQNIPFVLRVVDRYLVLKRGEIVDEGSAKAPDAVASIVDHLRV